MCGLWYVVCGAVYRITWCVKDEIDMGIEILRIIFLCVRKGKGGKED